MNMKSLFTLFPLTACFSSCVSTLIEQDSRLTAENGIIQLSLGDNLADYMQEQIDDAAIIDGVGYPISLHPRSACFEIEGKKYSWTGDPYMRLYETSDNIALDSSLFNIRSAENEKRYPVINQYMEIAKFQRKNRVNTDLLRKELTEFLKDTNEKVTLLQDDDNILEIKKIEDNAFFINAHGKAALDAILKQCEEIMIDRYSAKGEYYVYIHQGGQKADGSIVLGTLSASGEPERVVIEFSHLDIVENGYVGGSTYFLLNKANNSIETVKATQ